MKLRNKKTGKIGNLVLNINPNRESYSVLSTENSDTVCGNLVIADYDSLAELNEEWEDYEEPKPWWYIDITLVVKQGELFLSKHVEQFKTVGNYFETKEEAEKAVEKLKAWKRLKEARFAFGLPEYTLNEDSSIIGATGSVGFSCLCYEDFYKDLDLLFGGEE